MSLDLASVLVITALVVNVSGVLFILETLLRRDEGAGRIWSLGFLAAMLTTLSYVVWARLDDAWWAVAVGNAAFVAGTGCMWLGCRRFNGRSMAWPSLLVGAGVGAAAVSVAVEGEAGGDWAGALWMFAALMVFASLGAAECLRGALRASRTAWVLGIVLGLQSLYYAARTTAFLISGPESTLFQAAFGTISTSFLTVTLTIVAVVVTSVLRAARAPMRGYLRQSSSDPAEDGIATRDEFADLLASLCARAATRSELVAVTGVRIDDLDQISSAFGTDVAAAIAEAWRAGVRRHAPANAVVGQDGSSGLVVGIAVFSADEARRQAGAIYRGLFDDLGKVGGGVIPVIGVGVALSDAVGHHGGELVRVAREAAGRAATSVESSV
uniref:hypothetical protein n=1 Tax=Microbacterium sp. CPCC 204701 TaxID=2493084 RepID=UPI000FDB5A82